MGVKKIKRLFQNLLLTFPNILLRFIRNNSRMVTQTINHSVKSLEIVI